MINGAEQAAKEIYEEMPKQLIKEQECLMVLLLDTKNKPIGKPKMIAMGTVNNITVHPRDIFRDAVKHNAVGLIIAHNHPSGDLVPSQDDWSLTARLKQGGELLGINLLDHLIIAPDGKHLSILNT